MKSLRVKSGAKILFSGTKQIQVRVRRGATGDNGSFFGPAPGSSLRVQDIILYVMGTDAQSSFTYAVNISPKSTVSANIYAPNGTLLLNQQTNATGAFFGKVVRVGVGVNLALASAFTGASASSKVIPGAPDEKPAQTVSLPTSFALMQNYPNPFNPTTTIRYAIPQQTHVTLSIFNMLGQEVARLVDQTESQGYYEVLWNGRSAKGTDASSGLYIYRIKAGEFIDIKKMLFLK